MCNVAQALIEQGIEQGIEKGIEQGIEKGIEKGIEQGIEKGISILVESLNELGQSREFILNKLVTGYGLSEKEAEKYLV